jgi:hypothetical protein
MDCYTQYVPTKKSISLSNIIVHFFLYHLYVFFAFCCTFEREKNIWMLFTNWEERVENNVAQGVDVAQGIGQGLFSIQTDERWWIRCVFLCFSLL